MSSTGAEERERQTRRRRIDGRLEGRGWSVVPADAPRKLTPEAITEYETDHGRLHLVENLSICPEDFANLPVFAREGGWRAANRALDNLPMLLRRCNELVAA